MVPEGVTWRSSCIANHESFAVMLLFISLADPHLCKNTQTYTYIYFEIKPIWGDISWRELRTEKGKAWADGLYHNWGIILYIQSKLIGISILLNECLGRWYMQNFQIRKKSFSPWLTKTDILILVNSDCIAMECPENTIACTQYACIQYHQ